MLRRIAATGALAAALLAPSPSASAGGTAWSVSIGLPGLAISAGQPGYWGGARGTFVGVGVGYGGYRYGDHGYGHRPAYRTHHRPYHVAPFAPVPVPVYRAPVTYVAPYAYGAPVPYAIPAAPARYWQRVYAPQRAYVAAPPPPMRYAPY